MTFSMSAMLKKKHRQSLVIFAFDLSFVVVPFLVVAFFLVWSFLDVGLNVIFGHFIPVKIAVDTRKSSKAGF